MKWEEIHWGWRLVIGALAVFAAFSAAGWLLRAFLFAVFE